MSDWLRELGMPFATFAVGAERGTAGFVAVIEQTWDIEGGDALAAQPVWECPHTHARRGQAWACAAEEATRALTSLWGDYS